MAFNVFVKRWLAITKGEKKISQGALSLLITGNVILERQYVEGDGRLGNFEHIPMDTLNKLFRDQFGNELKIVQLVDGVYKELDPRFFAHHSINNPNRKAWGRSQFFSLANPRPVVVQVDPNTDQPQNTTRTTIPLLDAQALLQAAEVEIKQYMAKPRILASAPGTNRQQMNALELEMSDPNNKKYIWFFDKPVTVAEASIQSSTKFDKYGENVDAHIDIGTVFASKVVTQPGGFSYSSSQTPFDVLDQRMADLQNDFSEFLKEELLRPLADSWGFEDFDDMKVSVTFTPIHKKPSLDDIIKIPDNVVCAKEKRLWLRDQNYSLDDNLFNEAEDKQKQDQIEQMQHNMDLVNVNGGDKEEKGGDRPFGGGPQIPPEHEQSRPTPNQFKEALKAALKEVLAEERIPLPPSAFSKSTSDLYVNQGLDTPGIPEITDPNVKLYYDRSAPQKQEDEMQLDPSLNKEQPWAGNKKPTDHGYQPAPEKPIAGSDHQGGVGDDGINAQSDGSLKDPTDRRNESPKTPETGNTAITNPQEGPGGVMSKPRVPDLKTYNSRVSGGDEEDTKIVGGAGGDPTEDSERDPREHDKTSYINKMNLKNKVPNNTEKTRDMKTSEPWVNPMDDPNPAPEQKKNFARLEDTPYMEVPPELEKNHSSIADMPNNKAKPIVDGVDSSKIQPPKDKVPQHFPPQNTNDDSVPVPDRDPGNPTLDQSNMDVKPDEYGYKGAKNIMSKPKTTNQEPLEDEFENGGQGLDVMPEQVRQMDPNQPRGTEPKYQINKNGVPVPDLRFDQSPDSIENQPEITDPYLNIDAEQIPQEEGISGPPAASIPKANFPPLEKKEDKNGKKKTRKK